MTSDSPASSKPVPSEPPLSARHARLRALDVDSSGIAAALASSMLGSGEETQSLPSLLLALPEPPNVPEAPRPLLTSEQAQTYLKPLYSRGWFVSSARDIRDPAQRGLTKIGEFKTGRLAHESLIQLLKECHRAAVRSLLFHPHYPC